MRNNLLNFDLSAPYLQKVSKDMTQRQMREYYIYQTEKTLEEWEKKNFSIRDNPPFHIDSADSSSFIITPEIAEKINLKAQIEAFEQEAKISTGGVRENQNVVCPWDHRYRINEYMIAVMAESIALLVKDIHPQRMVSVEKKSAEEITKLIGEKNVKVIESIFKMHLSEIIDFVRENPVRIVGGEVRANTPEYASLMSRIYAGQGLYTFTTEKDDCSNTSSIFMWSFLIFILGLSGGDFFTSSHGAPQKMCDKILAFDGAQYLPDTYSKIVEKMKYIYSEIEKGGYEIKLSARDDKHLIRTINYENTAKLYCDYLRQGPASEKAIKMIKEAESKGLRLMLDCFGGGGFKTISSILKELGVFGVFENGLIRTEEDPFFHNIGFVINQKKGSDEYEVAHVSVDASVPKVIETAGYDVILADSPNAQLIFNVDPDADRFVGCQLVPSSEKEKLDKLGILYNVQKDGRLLALYSPNQLFLMIMDNDLVQSKKDGLWDKYSNFDIHTYVSALAWDEWAEINEIPVLRVPVGFKEIAAIEKSVEQALKKSSGNTFTVKNELGQEIVLGNNPKLHHAGEESGGKIGGPRNPIFNILGEYVIAMREKSSGEACISAITLQARRYLESIAENNNSKLYLHNYLEEIFEKYDIVNRMEYRGDIIHYNEAIIDPAELAIAKKEGLKARDMFNHFFRYTAEAYKTGNHSKTGDKISLEAVKDIFIEAMPVTADLMKDLEDIYVWSDGLQFWFKKGSKIRDLCLRPSGTDAKSKVYFDGTDKEYMKKIFAEGFAKVDGHITETYKKYIM